MKRKALFMVAALALLVAACSTDKAVGPKRPSIKEQPQGFIFAKGQDATNYPLTVTATTKDKKAKLTYQWYSNKINSAKGGAKVKDATGKLVSGVPGGEFTPPTDTVGVFYYYVTVSSALHKETAKRTSEVAVITVMDVAAEDMPVINAQNGDGDSDPSATVIGDDLVLTVDVEDSDDPIVSYQWYKNTRNSNVGGTLIPDATSATYIAPTDVEGTMYYYVVITTQSGKTLTSLPIKVTVVLEKPVDPDDPEDPDNPGPPPKVDARPPVILEHPQGGAVYITGNPAEPLTVSAFTDDGTLSYQWYAGGTIIDGATEAEYTPSTDTAGTVSYHVVVTNTIYDNGDGGTKTAQATSNAAVIQVRDRVHAQTPDITEHPESASYDDQYVGPAVPLSVTVSVTDGGTLTYQWYKNTENSNEGGTAIDTATEATYTPPINVATKSMDYYYVEITNTIPDNGDGGVKTVTITSYPAYIAVNIVVLEIGGISVQNKVYDGTTAATFTGGTISGYGTDDVTLHKGTAEFAQADAGNDIPVTLIGWYLEGSDSGEYILVLPATLKANITKAPAGTVIDPPSYTYTYVYVDGSITDCSVELIAVTLSTGQTPIYAIFPSDTWVPNSPQFMNSLGWQESPVFTGLQARTFYSVMVRAKENDNYLGNLGDGVSGYQFRSFQTLSPVVHFVTNGGNSLSDVTVLKGEKLPQPAAISRFNYTFDWWYTNEAMTTPYDFDNVVNNGMTLYAKWIYNPDITAMDTKDMVFVPGGWFMMGSPSGETGRSTFETQHKVTLNGFWMGKYLVTQEKWEAIMGSNPSYFHGGSGREPYGSEIQGKRPVEGVNWCDALVFCNKLSMAEGLEPAYIIDNSTDPDDWGQIALSTISGWETIVAKWSRVLIVAGSNGYRLPTEAQWERACRAGTTTAYNTGATADTNTGWYSENSGNKTHQVGLKPANAWGLYDMHGNVREWCWDSSNTGNAVNPADYGSASQVNPGGSSHSSSYTLRVLRGGFFKSAAGAIRSASRIGSNFTTRAGSGNTDYIHSLRLVRPAN